LNNSSQPKNDKQEFHDVSNIKKYAYKFDF
jgi:hypothetical protein